MCILQSTLYTTVQILEQHTSTHRYTYVYVRIFTYTIFPPISSQLFVSYGTFRIWRLNQTGVWGPVLTSYRLFRKYDRPTTFSKCGTPLKQFMRSGRLVFLQMTIARQTSMRTYLTNGSLDGRQNVRLLLGANFTVRQAGLRVCTVCKVHPHIGPRHWFQTWC